MIQPKEPRILSDRPTINCCLTTSKGFRTRFPTIYAQIEAQIFFKGLSCNIFLMLSQTQKNEKEQGNDTIIWQENPLNLLFAIDLRFSPGEEPMIRVLMVYNGQKTRSTAIPAHPPAMPCFKSAIIIFSISQISGKYLSILPHTIVQTFFLPVGQRTFLETNAFGCANRNDMFKCSFVFWISFEERFNVGYFLLTGLSQILHNIFMQHPTLTLIIRYPNDTLHLATQQHLKNKMIVRCVSCPQILEVVTKNTREFTCKRCHQVTKIEAAKGQNCKKQGCQGQLKLMMSATGMMTEQCTECDYREIVNFR